MIKWRPKFLKKLSLEVGLIAFCCTGALATGYFLLKPRSQIKRVEVKAENLGFVKPLGEDVRVRGETEPSWNHVDRDANVYRNDRLFTGSSSSAKVTLKSQEMFTVEPNSLIVISDDRGQETLNISSGSFLSELKKGATLMVQVMNHKAEVRPKKDSVIRLASNGNDSIELVVLKGEASVTTPTLSVPQIVRANEEVRINNQEKIEVKPLEISLIEPAPGTVLWDRGEKINFSWEILGAKNAQNTHVRFQIATDPLFKDVIENVSSDKSSASSDLTPGKVYFWRVVGDNLHKSPNKSPTSSFCYYALQAPELPKEQTVDGGSVRLSWEDRSLSEDYL